MSRLLRAAAIAIAAGTAFAMTIPAASPASAAATPTRVVVPGSPGPYGGYSTGSIAHVSALGVVGTTVAQLSLGQSSAGAAVGQALVRQDKLGSSILTAPTAGKSAYGHGSGANVALLQDPAAVPQIALTTAESTSPVPNTATPTVLLPLNVAPLATANVLPSTAQALSATAGSACATNGALISQGRSQIANATVLNTAGTSALTAGATSTSLSQTGLEAPVGNAAGQGLTTRTQQTLAPLDVLSVLGAAGIKVEVLKDIVLSTTAGGVNGSAKVSYGFAGVATNNTTIPVLALTVGGQRVTLTSQQLLGNGGLKLALGVADIFIGAPAHGLNDNPLSSPGIAANGRSASAAADFIRITVPGTVTVGNGNTPPVGGPLAGLLNPVLQPVVTALSPVLAAVQTALTAAGLNVADIRYGHLEASTLVPAGGIICPGSEDNPLDESSKDVSSLSAAPGSTFDYTVRFPNRGTAPITGVKVKDVFSPGLEFVRSVPAPTSRSGNTLNYDIGTLQPGQFAQIVLTFRVPSDAAAGTKYRNTATISGTYRGVPITTTVVAEGPTVNPIPSGPCDVSQSTKYASNTQVTTGERFGYFINVSNTGSRDCTGVVVKDTVPTGTTFVSCTKGCTVSGRTITWDVGTLTGGSSETLSFTVRVTATSGRLPNVAVITPDNGTPARPTTPGPTITRTSVPAPGDPAGCPATGCAGDPGDPGTDLPRTGFSDTLPIAGLVLMGLAALGLRRRRLV